MKDRFVEHIYSEICILDGIVYRTHIIALAKLKQQVNLCSYLQKDQ